MKRLLLLLISPILLSHAAAQVANPYAPVSMTLVAIGYEMDQKEADKLVKANDPAVDATAAAKQAASRVSGRAATVSTTVILTTNSGTRGQVSAGGARLEVEGILSPDRTFASVTTALQKTAQGLNKTASAKVNIGGYLYFGMVPGSKPGTQELLFLRLLLQ